MSSLRDRLAAAAANQAPPRPADPPRRGRARGRAATAAAGPGRAPRRRDRPRRPRRRGPAAQATPVAAATRRRQRRPAASAPPRRAPRAAKLAPARAGQHRSRTGSRSSSPACTASCSSSSARSSTTPTWTRTSSSRRVRAVLLDVLGAPGPPAQRERPVPDHPGDQRRHPGLRPDRALPARPGRQRGHGQRRDQHLPRAQGQADRRPTRSSPTRPTCAASSTRSSPAIGRRVDESSPMVDARLPDGSRVNAVIPPLAIDGSSLTIRKFAADPLTVHDLIDFGSLSPADGRVPRRLRPRPPQHHRLRQHRRRQDDHAQRAVVLHPGRRAHRHHRGRRRAPAQAGPRGPARVPPGQHRGQGRGPPSATWSRTACACGPTASSSVRSATPPRSTCSRP